MADNVLSVLIALSSPITRSDTGWAHPWHGAVRNAGEGCAHGPQIPAIEHVTEGQQILREAGGNRGRTIRLLRLHGYIG